VSKVVYFEIPVDDPDRAAGFYRDALGWAISRFGDEPYWLVRAGADEEPGANGALTGHGDLHRGVFQEHEHLAGERARHRRQMSLAFIEDQAAARKKRRGFPEHPDPVMSCGRPSPAGSH
jgi:catechol 2,3-dioxygenase-like lactoylglutathione lyase family enzyme